MGPLSPLNNFFIIFNPQLFFIFLRREPNGPEFRLERSELNPWKERLPIKERMNEMTHLKRKSLLVSFFLFLLLGLFFLTSIVPPTLEAKDKSILTIPRLQVRPEIDGVLDNPLWEEQALKIDGFLQLSPKEKGTPSEKTVAYIGYDDENLYLAFRCFDTDKNGVRASVTTRDNCIDDDWVVVFLDTFNEKRRAFVFFVNPLGIQIDGLRTEEGGNDNMNMSWDTVFRSEGKIDEEGYTVEMSIPFKSLRFPAGPPIRWNVVLGRNIPRKGEVIIWPPVSRQIPGLLVQGQEIILEGQVERGKNLELMPVVTSLQREKGRPDLQPGVNVKYGVSSDMTADLTLNPDFSHIEADAPQIDINLRYALRYPEKRPFFLEGMEIFQFPEIEMVYPRRIIDPLWGAKLSGKMGGWTYGLLSAYDQKPTESLWEVHGNGGTKDEKALFNIVRLKRDILGQFYVGFSLTDKEIDGSFNRVAGLDGQFRFKNRFFFSFQALASKTKWEGKETGLAPALYSEFSYFTKHWSAGAWWKSIHPDFEAAAGFVNRVDYRSGGVYSSLTLYPDKKYLNAIFLNLSLGRRDGYFDGVTQDTWTRGMIQFRLTEFNRLFFLVQNGLERYENRDFWKTTYTIETENNLIRWLPFYLYFQTGDAINYDPDDPFLGWSTTLGLSLNFKPSPRLQLGLDYSRNSFWQQRGGEKLWDYDVIRQKTTFQFSRRLSLRAILDYNFFYDRIFGSFLFSYVVNPGTVFFLGIDTNAIQDEGRQWKRQNYSLFIKFSYWWRL
jgi:hypothetical protein